MGLMLGWQFLLVALFIAYLTGAVIGIILILTGKKKWQSQVPFGTFLALATVISLFWGEALLRWYLSLF